MDTPGFSLKREDKRPRLWIRADGSASLGLGHVMRGVAIAEEANRRGIPPLFVAVEEPAVRRVLLERGWHLHSLGSATETEWISGVRDGDLVVFDGYHFTNESHGAASEAGARVGIIDDLGSRKLDVSVVLNPNPRRAYNYEVPDDCRLLLGPENALIRQEFLNSVKEPPEGAGSRLLVTMGGSDAGDVAGAVLSVLDEVRPFKSVLLVEGPAGRSRRRGGRDWLEIVRSPRHVAPIYSRAAAAISSAGSTTWELLSLGIATAVVHTASNQGDTGAILAEAGAAFNVGRAEDLFLELPPILEKLAEPELRTRVARQGNALVGKRGASRFLDALAGDSNE